MFSYASAVKAHRTKIYSVSAIDKARTFGLAVKALWGDVDAYNPKEDGSYETYFLESARKRTAVVKVEPTPEEIEADKERFKEAVERRERLQEQARRKVEEEAAFKAAEEERQKRLCKCGCGREAHSAPRPDFAGYCCGWCKQHKGKRGHGPACGNN